MFFYSFPARLHTLQPTQDIFQVESIRCPLLHSMELLEFHSTTGKCMRKEHYLLILGLTNLY
jgi:hypothetical protein